MISDKDQAPRFEPRQNCSDTTPAQVQIAWDPRAEREVVLKRGAGDALAHEARLLLRLAHPNLMTLEEIALSSAGPYLVLSYARGTDLVTWTQAGDPVRRSSEGVAALLPVLAYLHSRGIIHRDLKPEHVRVRGPTSAPEVTLLDLGLATDVPQAETVGTRDFVAPELATGQPASAASDRYALGAVLHAALSGVPPELTPGGVRLAPFDAPDPLREIVVDLLAEAPKRRPSLIVVADTLSVILGRPVSLDVTRPSTLEASLPRVLSERHLAILEALVAQISAGESVLWRLDGAPPPGTLRTLCDLAALGEVQALRLSRFTDLEEALDLAPRPSFAADQRASRVIEALATRGHMSTRKPRLSQAKASAFFRLEQPLLLAFDKLDTTTVAFLMSLARIVNGDPLEGLEIACVWLASDEGDIPETRATSSRRGVHDLSIPPLNTEEVRGLVNNVLYQTPDPAWVATLANGSRGRPRRLLAALRAQVQDPATATLSPSIPTTQLTSRATAALGLDSTVASLSSPERDLLGTIGLAVSPIETKLLATIASPSAMATLGSLAARELLRLDAAGISLAPGPELRALALAPLDPDARRSIHARYAKALRKADARAADRAHHLLYGGDLTAAVALFADADGVDDADLEFALDLALTKPTRLSRDAQTLLMARVAKRRRATGDLDGAIALAEASPAKGRPLLLAELLLDAGEPTRALAILRTSALDKDAQATLLAARAEILIGDFNAAIHLAQRGLKLTQVTEERLRLANVLGLGQLYAGDIDTALSTLEGALRQATETRNREDPSRRDLPESLSELGARLKNSLGIVYQRLGRLDDAQAAYSDCLSLFRHLGDLRLAATTALNLGTVAHERGALGDALKAYRDARSLAHRANLGTTLGWALANEGNLLVFVGAFAEAKTILDDAAKRAHELGGGSLAGHIDIYRADLARLQGKISAARKLLERASQHFDSSDLGAQKELLLSRGELDLIAEDSHALAATRASIEALAAESGFTDAKVLWLTARIDLALGRDAQQVDKDLDQALALAFPLGRPALLSEMAARAALRAGDKSAHDQAEETSRALRALRDQIPPRYRQAFDLHPAVIDIQERLKTLHQAGKPSIAGFERLLEITRKLNQRLPLDTLLARILDGAIELSGAERGFILLQGGRAGRGQKLRLVAARTTEGERLRHGLAKLSQGIAEEAIRQGRTLVLADAGADERFRSRLSVSGLKLRAVLCVPLAVGDKRRGALYLDNRFGVDVFTPSIVALAEAFGEQSMTAIENTRLLAESAKRGEDLAAAKAELERLNQRLETDLARQSAALSEIRVRLDHQEEELVRRYNAAQIIGRSKPMRDLFAKLDRIAHADLPVVIQGESGTGKELVARALHRASDRADDPFVALNCGAIPASLLESELFGYARGAFTGATHDRPGIFEVAGKGTLFLDEVGDMDAGMQVKLLRVLQEGRYRRLGEDRERASQCRVISASHKRLEDLVADGTFRDDLYYRLHVLGLDLPALRERRPDIPLLVRHLLAQSANDSRHDPVAISRSALNALVDYAWPGNVRQLQNELARATLLCTEHIELDDLSPEIREAYRRSHGAMTQGPRAEAADANDATRLSLKAALSAYERELITFALDEAEGNVTRAAKALGLHRVALHRKLRTLDISRSSPSPQTPPNKPLPRK